MLPPSGLSVSGIPHRAITLLVSSGNSGIAVLVCVVGAKFSEAHKMKMRKSRAMANNIDPV
jgi:hypothetical protein